MSGHGSWRMERVAAISLNGRALRRGRRLLGLAGLCGSDPVGPHHFVVFVFDEWQCHTNWPGVVNRAFTRVTCPG